MAAVALSPSDPQSPMSPAPTSVAGEGSGVVVGTVGAAEGPLDTAAVGDAGAVPADGVAVGDEALPAPDGDGLGVTEPGAIAAADAAGPIDPARPLPDHGRRPKQQDQCRHEAHAEQGRLPTGTTTSMVVRHSHPLDVLG